ncbi:MAG: hypothetical protein ACFFDT_31330, partial [Candidatus Hodarchaeota archaeon]
MRFRYFFLIARKILFKRKSTVLTASLAVAATIFLTIFTGVVFEGVTNTALIDFADFQYGDLLIRNEKTEEIDRPYQQVIDSVARYPLVEAAA